MKDEPNNPDFIIFERIRSELLDIRIELTDKRTQDKEQNIKICEKIDDLTYSISNLSDMIEGLMTEIYYK